MTTRPSPVYMDVPDRTYTSREEVQNFQLDHVLAPVARRRPLQQRTFSRSVWCGVWLMVAVTLVIIHLMYDSHYFREHIVPHWPVGVAFLVIWLVFTLVSWDQSWAVNWSLNAQIGFALIAVLIQSIILGYMVALAFHRVGLFATIFFFYLLSLMAVLSLRWFGGLMTTCSLVVLAIATISLLALIVGPLHFVEHNEALGYVSQDNGWIVYPYHSSVRWLEPPMPIWRSYVAALLGTLNMMWAVWIFRKLAHEHEHSQVWFVIARVYLAIVYSWQLVWCFCPKYGCPRGRCCCRDREIVSQ